MPEKTYCSGFLGDYFIGFLLQLVFFMLTLTKDVSEFAKKWSIGLAT